MVEVKYVPRPVCRLMNNTVLCYLDLVKVVKAVVDCCCLLVMVVVVVVVAVIVVG